MSISKLLGQFHKPLIMGILNLTEDSFSDGAQYLKPSVAIKHAEKLISDGADIIDIGAESTRPGAKPISAGVQWQRIKPILSAIKDKHPTQPISIDTQLAEVAAKSIALGANIINDISALRTDPAMIDLLAEHEEVSVVLMHMQGSPQTMQDSPRYDDVMGEVCAFLKERAHYAMSKGISKSRIILDPGIGFGKTAAHNLTLLAHLDELKALGYRVLLGASRKRFIDYVSASDVKHRLGGSLATTAVACLAQTDLIRVHDVQAHKQFIDLLSAISEAGGS